MFSVWKTRSLRRFRRAEGGGATIEFMLWIPIFVALLTGAVDVGTIFAHKSNYWSVARDTARQVARHAMTPAQARTYAEEQATLGSTVPSVTVERTTNDVTVSISGSATTIAAFGVFQIFDGQQISARVTYALEPT